VATTHVRTATRASGARTVKKCIAKYEGWQGAFQHHA
jgi:hypothetical protein